MTEHRHAADETIERYVRSRGEVPLPPDLVDGVMAEARARSQRRAAFTGWAWILVPAAAAVVVVAILSGVLPARPDSAGPAPEPGPSGSVEYRESRSPATPAPSLSEPATELSLLRPGDTLAIDAIDAEGTWGMVRLTRGEDRSGYVHVDVLDDSFVIEVFVEYEPQRLPEPAEFGRDDWSLVTADGMPVGSRLQASGVPEPDRQPLGAYPGAVDIFTTPPAGWLLFELPRQGPGAGTSVTEEELFLRYTPAAVDEPVASVHVREPGPAPEPIPAPTPMPSPTYVNHGGPFTVLDSPEADALFADPDTCTNPDDGYTVTYPDSWYTNTAIGDLPACSWFSPTTYEVADPSVVPEEIAITVDVVDGALGFLWVELYSENVALDGFSGRRFEHGHTKDGSIRPDRLTYTYHLDLDAAVDGRTFVGMTDTAYGGDYPLNKAVLDRMVASLSFE